MRLWLKDKRKEKGLRQIDVAENCGISNTFYANIELGVKNPSVKVAMLIGTYLEVDWTIFYE